MPREMGMTETETTREQVLETALLYYARGCDAVETPEAAGRGDIDMATSCENWNEDAGDKARSALATPPDTERAALVEALRELADATRMMLAEIDTCGHEVDPAYRGSLHDAHEKARAALSRAKP